MASINLIVADTDGVVRVPADLVEQVLETAEEIERRESEQTRLILEARSLKTGLDLYNRV